MIRRLAPIAALALSGCYNTEPSPGRIEMLSRSFECAATGTIPQQVRAVFLRHGSRLRERHPDPAFYVATGTVGPSEFGVQIIGGNAHIKLYTADGVPVTAEERAIFAQFMAAFARCRSTRQMSDVGSL